MAFVGVCLYAANASAADLEPGTAYPVGGELAHELATWAGVGSLAGDGSSFLVAWVPNDPIEPTLFTTRVDASGAVSAGHPVTSLTKTVYDETWSRLAYDGSEYLVVWAQYNNSDLGLRAIRLDPNGDAIDPQPLVLWSEAAYSFDVAGGPDGFLVAFTDHDMGVHALLVGTDGGIGPTLLVPHPSPGGMKLRVAYAGDVYLVLERHYSGVYGARVSSGGALLDAQGLTIAKSPSYLALRLAATGVGDQFDVLWEQSAPPRLIAATVSTDGSVLEKHEVAQASFLEVSDVTPADGSLLATFEENPAEVARLDPSLQLAGEQPAASATDIEWSAKDHVALVLGEAGARRYSETLETLDPAPFSVMTAERRAERDTPSIAAVGKHVLVAWLEKLPNGSKVASVQPLSVDGEPSGPVTSWPASAQPQLIAGSQNMLAIWATLEGTRASRLDFDGTPLDNPPLSLPGGAGFDNGVDCGAALDDAYFIPVGQTLYRMDASTGTTQTENLPLDKHECVSAVGAGDVAAFVVLRYEDTPGCEYCLPATYTDLVVVDAELNVVFTTTVGPGLAFDVVRGDGGWWILHDSTEPQPSPIAFVDDTGTITKTMEIGRTARIAWQDGHLWSAEQTLHESKVLRVARWDPETGTQDGPVVLTEALGHAYKAGASTLSWSWTVPDSKTPLFAYASDSRVFAQSVRVQSKPLGEPAATGVASAKGGCGCRVSRSAGDGGGWLGALVLAFLFGWRRRPAPRRAERFTPLAVLRRLANAANVEQPRCLAHAVVDGLVRKHQPIEGRVKTVGRVGQAVPGPRRFPHWRGWTPPCSRAASAPRPPPAVECPRSAHRKSTPRAARPRSCSWPQRVSQAAVPERHGPHQEKPSSASHGTRAGSFTYSSK